MARMALFLGFCICVLCVIANVVAFVIGGQHWYSLAGIIWCGAMAVYVGALAVRQP